MRFFSWLYIYEANASRKGCCILQTNGSLLLVAGPYRGNSEIDDWIRFVRWTWMACTALSFMVFLYLSPLATLADSVTITGSAFERDIPWSLIPGGKLAKESGGENVVIITWSKRGRYILVHTVSCVFWSCHVFFSIFVWWRSLRRLINSRWFPSSKTRFHCTLSFPVQALVISVPRSEALTVTVSLTDYRVDLPQPCHPIRLLCQHLHQLLQIWGSSSWNARCGARMSWQSLMQLSVILRSKHFILVMIPKGGPAFVLGDKMW